MNLKECIFLKTPTFFTLTFLGLGKMSDIYENYFFSLDHLAQLRALSPSLPPHRHHPESPGNVGWYYRSIPLWQRSTRSWWFHLKLAAKVSSMFSGQWSHCFGEKLAYIWYIILTFVLRFTVANSIYIRKPTLDYYSLGIVTQHI